MELRVNAPRQRRALSFALVRDTRGATSTEYIIIVAFVALASVSAFLFLGKAVDRNFTSARSYVLYPVP
jgi:Flp pilus assembly pilin Flp